MTTKLKIGAVTALSNTAFAFTANAETAQVITDGDSAAVLVTWPVLLVGAALFLFWSGIRRASN